MKLQILSDLHLESQAFTLKTHPDADAVVLAGDIAAWSARKRMESLIKSCPKPVIYIPGNHEAYKSTMDRVWEADAEMSRTVSHFKNLTQYQHCYEMGDVMIIGCTLWTNFSLPFWHQGKKIQDQTLAMGIANQGIADFTMIKDWTPMLAAREYSSSVRYLQWMIERYPDKKVVVVTHFLPSERSIDPQYARSSLNPYFASDTEFLMMPQVKLWIHGHTHHSCDYMVRDTRVVCNPRGYTKTENPAFDSQLLIEV